MLIFMISMDFNEFPAFSMSAIGKYQNIACFIMVFCMPQMEGNRDFHDFHDFNRISTIPVDSALQKLLDSLCL